MNMFVFDTTFLNLFSRIHAKVDLRQKVKDVKILLVKNFALMRVNSVKIHLIIFHHHGYLIRFVFQFTFYL
ncbi:hypothetical protein RhiirA1_180856 [Rhizophagus irregularis]|uniref:Uncharacterized protein n=1 Tax=Rhizophagus irregularis TaxID=588596 RepID=A0A2N0RTG8_9GLOM|nr:hypothetical protein RhiirA1_180856 [Rhizophagus irregularis]GET64966.1 hypothetical protein RIR_jg3032.t1 [Rhizophagus irregularis DAOM 181602=DAOM 197198]